MDWVEKYADEVGELGDYTDVQRKEYLEGIVDRINVSLEKNTKDHHLDIVFRLPLVGDWHESIHLFSALGSRGLTNAPLLGLVLARKIAHRPAGLERKIMRLIDPERFSIRVTRSKSRR